MSTPKSDAMETSPLATWAEVVSDVGPVTVDDLLRLPDDSWRHEVIEGVLVRMAGSGGDDFTDLLGESE